MTCSSTLLNNFKHKFLSNTTVVSLKLWFHIFFNGNVRFDRMSSYLLSVDMTHGLFRRCSNRYSPYRWTSNHRWAGARRWNPFRKISPFFSAESGRPIRKPNLFDNGHKRFVLSSESRSLEEQQRKTIKQTQESFFYIHMCFTSFWVSSPELTGLKPILFSQILWEFIYGGNIGNLE